ncbi:nicotinamide riboside transporter PnuC [Aquimarina hainanensis]|uniref:Nicotinamide riboside transporter PnuC n=1 Tax=Aquimarina hainanensis TaxID=1578017 RepID=A0ABW5N1B3_9FLAO|nr:nicotinamide riboside transporter PnuC [Aquimarina sp. TRL1]QKX04472.1 nicotinamide mononucleotide transporter [Aquimarina sp. TRL1]
MSQIFDFFLNAYSETPTSFIVLEAIAFVFGILSVFYAKKVHIWVYPTGLLATVISVYLLYKAAYFGDMMMNFYYSIMSLYGWWNWSRKNNNSPVVPVSRTNLKEKLVGFFMFSITMFVTYMVYALTGVAIQGENWIDIFTSGVFFTAMWYMANKKIENWTLWIFADIITVPLYAYRGLGMLSLQYLIFTVIAILGYLAWKKSLDKNKEIV